VLGTLFLFKYAMSINIFSIHPRRFNKWPVASPERGFEGIAAVFVMKRGGGS